MIFYAIAIILSILVIISLIYPKPYLQPTTLLLYALTSWLLGLITVSQWTPIYVIRYFFYVISGFAMAAIPFILLLLAFLIIHRLSQEELPLWRYVLNILIAVAYIVFALYSLSQWYFLREDLTALLQTHIMLGLFITANFISYLLLTLLLNIFPKRQKVEVLVVLGAQVENNEIPKMLMARLNAAYQLYLKQAEAEREKIVFIVTGGLDTRYSDVSEAELMKDYLMDLGVPEEQIIVESKARNTYENLIYSQEIMQDWTLENLPMIITSNFHLLRTYFLAHQAGLRASFKGARTPLWLWPYYLVREYVAYLMLVKEVNYLYILFVIIYSILSVL